MNATPEKVWGCVKPLAGTLRDKWDENVSSFEIIESLTDVSLSRHCYPNSKLTPSLWRGSGTPFGKGRTLHNPETPANTGCPLLATLRPNVGPGRRWETV